MARHYLTAEEKRAHDFARMKRAEAAVGADIARFRPMANTMAAGPCAGCLEIEQHLYRADEAPLMPLDSCPHPDQCVGNYRLELADES